MKNKVKIEDRFFLCRHVKGNFCTVIMHRIENGHAVMYHCGRCNKFEEKKVK